MIYDTLDNAAIYKPLGLRFELGFRYLAEFDPQTADGRVKLDDENVFALIQSYVPYPAAQRLFEAHKIYADIQFVAVGEEAIYHSAITSLRETTPYSVTTDAAFYAGDDDFPLLMRPGSFGIFHPSDGHKPCCAWRGLTLVKKVVVKIRL